MEAVYPETDQGNTRPAPRQDEEHLVRDAGSLRRYRTEIPNLVFEMELDPYELTLYAHYKRVAGPSGACWQSTRTIAKNTRMSVGKVAEARASLEAKDLINVEEPEARNKSMVVTVCDIWPANMKHFDSRSRSGRWCSPHEHQRSPSEPKKEPKKKEPFSSLRAAGAAQGEKEKEEVPSGASPPTTSTLSVVGDDQPQEADQGEGVPVSAKTTPRSPSGQTAVTDLQRALKVAFGERHKLPEKKRGKYGGIFRELICKGTTTDGLQEIIDYIVKRWPEEQLLPNEAQAELRGERDAGGTRSSGSPPEVVEALRNYVHPKGFANDLRRYAALAERYDFSDEGEPPWWVTKELGENDLARIRSVAKRAIREAQAAEIGGTTGHESHTTATRIRSKGLEDGPEGSSTPDDDDGLDTVMETLDRLRSDPDSRAAALAMEASSTREDIAAALKEELDPEEFVYGSGIMATLLIGRVRFGDRTITTA